MRILTASADYQPLSDGSGRGFFVLPKLRHSHSVVIAHSSSLLGAAERRLAAAQMRMVIDATLRVMKALPKIFRKYLTQY